ncbi:hypothetical protein I1A62_26240 [Rhodococcus sp. USK10]|uniref:hypothetical protein n=1 Tax=Rhodococcus sp. USK10 TaxID=2789739 RepID=UPI001C605030|nr:hypothetical protein [Rhodococcus sp. USK10]QYB07711.1 hypothetical protein I1A62_26240 [Rhodococcus sp. USK10]
MVSARTVWATGRRSSANMASILALISAVLIAPLRRTGGREVIEDAGIIEAVVMRALPFIVSADSAHPVGVHPSSQ